MSQIKEATEEEYHALFVYTNLMQENPAWLYCWGLHLLENGQYKQAMRCFKKGHKLVPTEGHFVERIAHFSYFYNEFHRSATFYAKLAKIRPLSLDEKRKAAWAAQSSQKYKQATQYYEDLVLVYPTDTNIWVNMGFSYGKLDMSDKALACSIKAHDINPHDYVAMLNIGFRYWVLQDLVQARIFTEKALKGYSDYSYALMNLGHINWCEGNENKAIEYYRKSRQVMNNDKSFQKLMREDSKYITAYGITIEQFEEKLAIALA